MKRGLFILLAILVGCTKSLPPEVTKAVPTQYDINSPVFAHAKEELEEVVGLCGPGVVAGVAGENRCAYTVALDELFFRHPADKTGFKFDHEWPYKEGVKWATSATREVLPDAFDLRDLMKNGQPVIKNQKCGDCWAWSTHHGLEIVRAVFDQKVFDLSVQTVLSCSHQGSCGGGTMGAVDFLLHGLPLEEAFPYTGRDTRCKFSSSDISTGWDGKVVGTPNIGSSLRYSRGVPKGPDGLFQAHPTAEDMMQAMFVNKSPLVVTVQAYSLSGKGIYDSCSAINSGGNHMVTIVGWDSEGGHKNAHVWNSWGQAHGDHGVSRIKWECGAPGKLNRGLGLEAKVVQYKPPCDPPVVHIAKAKYTILAGEGNFVRIGSKAPAGQSCSWQPTEGLSDPSSCVTDAAPKVSTEYHLTATNNCGSISAMTLVEVLGPQGPSSEIITPMGVSRQ